MVKQLKLCLRWMEWMNENCNRIDDSRLNCLFLPVYLMKKLLHPFLCLYVYQMKVVRSEDSLCFGCDCQSTVCLTSSYILKATGSFWSSWFLSCTRRQMTFRLLLRSCFPPGKWPCLPQIARTYCPWSGTGSAQRSSTRACQTFLRQYWRGRRRPGN